MKTTNQLWIKGTPKEIKKIINSLQEQGYNNVIDVCEGFRKKEVVLL